MSPIKPTDPKITPAASVSLHTSEPSVEFDSQHLAWVKFDSQMDVEIALREAQLGKYLTRKAIRTSLGR
jgi:hypothetical protein